MIITKMELENWMRIQKLVLEFNKGINLIYGRNEIGKSSIIEAIRMAIIGDSTSSSREYKNLKTWGTEVKAKVDLFFTSRDNKNYHIRKSFPKGDSRLYLKEILLTEEAKKTQNKLFQILDLSEKTAKLFDLLFVNQGEALNIFSKQKNENPINEDTKSYIKDVIKETAFKPLQEFQNHLLQDWNTIFTSGGKLKKGQSASEYTQLLEKERELNKKKFELEEKAADFSRQLEEMEELEKKINRFVDEKKKKEKQLTHFKSKETKLEELEKKQLEFKPIEKDYNRFLDIEDHLAAIHRELPGLYALGKQIIAELETEMNNQKAREKETLHYQTALKQKKKRCEQVETFKGMFENLSHLYQDLLEINKRIRENDQRLPVLFVLNKEKLEEKRGEIESKINDYLKKQEALKAVDEQLKGYPKITKKDISQIKKISTDMNNLEAKLEAARSALKMKFNFTPHSTKEIRFNLRIDKGDIVPQTTAAPMAVENFQWLSFQYPDHFDIDITGRLAKVDIEALQKEHNRKQVELADQLNRLKVNSIEELDDKFQEYTDLKNRKNEMQDQLAQGPSLKDLHHQNSEIEADLESLHQDIAKYLGKGAAIENARPDETMRNRSSHVLRDELTKAKTTKDNLTDQLTAILTNRTFEAFEKDYFAKEKEYQQLQENLKNMEPKEIKEITQNHLDEAAEKLKGIEKKITDYLNHKNLLESMEGWEEFQKPGIKASPGPAQTPQQIRDAIHKSRTRLNELRKQRENILDGKKQDDFKTEYLLRKDAIATLTKYVSGMIPLEVHTLSDIKKGINTIEQEVNKISNEIDTASSRKAELSGEIKGFDGVIEEKNQVDYTYGKTLEDIKIQLTDIYALKLLLKLVKEEKEKAHQEIFKPLQERVILSLNRLIPGMYRLDLNNNLEFGISARTQTGDFQEHINDFLSYGTREQLSFLLRLAIAEQLSQKEPQLMILDDSFVNTDTTRLPHLLEMIDESSKEIQFLIFTCKERDYLQYKEKLHTINLEELI